MTKTGEFSALTVEILSKRAANHCSNPDCGILTIGPATDNVTAINIGEAAHIYGRTAESARYSPRMTPAENADITNGIWLCRNCHKEVDRDEKRFPAELLFEWRRAHERDVLERLGRKGDILREKLKNDRLKVFQDASYLAQQIVLDRPPHWEFKLAMELLSSELGAVHAKWHDLKNGLYVRKSTIVPSDQAFAWIGAKSGDLSRIFPVIEQLLPELNKSWGVVGVSGVDTEILRACRLIVAAASNLLEWEEDIRFSHIPEEFRELQSFLQGVAGMQLDEIMKIPAELSRILQLEDLSGTHEATLVFRLPENFAQDSQQILERCTQKYILSRSTR